ncbi:MAG: M28 family peptidase [Bacteroidota bacterium]|nr:M28 family peptidase [Bacteroidota bacterium]
MIFRVLILTFLFAFDNIQAQDDWQQIHVDVVYLASEDLEGRATGTKGEKLSAAYIAYRMNKIGLTPKGNEGWYQRFQFSSDPHNKDTKDITGTNVIGFLDRKAKYTIVIGAHHDHLGHGVTGSRSPGDHAVHNGADDNASGISSMLWLAEKLVREKKLKCNVLFIAFSGEEYGLFGSKAFTEKSSIPLTQIKAMINMDMVGRLNEEKVLAINGTGTSLEWKQILEEAKPKGFQFNYSEGGIGPSDHTSFYLKDIPVLHFFTGQHLDYHKPGDDSPLVNYTGILDVSKIILDVVKKTAQKQKMNFQKTKDENKQQVSSFKVTLGLMPDYVFSGTGMRVDAVLDNRPAQKAGMKNGDIIIRIGDLEIKDVYDYMKALGMYEKGQKAKLKILREKVEMELEAEF